MSSSPSLVAVDWGSSKFRAFLLNEDGVLLEQVQNNNGVFLSTRGASKIRSTTPVKVGFHVTENCLF